jgi:gluconokinase
MLANITGKKLVIVQQEDASAMGAIFLAIDALNLNLQISQKPPAAEMSLIPDQSAHQIYNKSFFAFKNLYENLKETMHLLHNM